MVCPVAVLFEEVLDDADPPSGCMSSLKACFAEGKHAFKENAADPPP